MNKFLIWLMSMHRSAQSSKNSPLNKFGITPLVSMVVFVVDWLLFSAETPTLFATWPVSISVGLLLGLWAARSQRKAGDTLKMSWVKGFGLAVLTAIPTPIGSLVAGLSLLGSILDTCERKADEALEENKKEQDTEAPKMRNVTPGHKSED